MLSHPIRVASSIFGELSPQHDIEPLIAPPDQFEADASLSNEVKEVSLVLDSNTAHTGV